MTPNRVKISDARGTGIKVNVKTLKQVQGHNSRSRRSKHSQDMHSPPLPLKAIKLLEHRRLIEDRQEDVAPTISGDPF